MLTFSEAQFAAWVSPLLWPFLRVLAMFTAAPVLSSRAFPVRAKIALAFLVALAAQPALPEAAPIGLNDPGAFGAVLQQVGIGLAIGFAVRVVIATLELAGQIVGFQMGVGFAAFFDPASSAQSSAVGRFYATLGALLFVVLDGHLLMVQAVVRSFEVFPVGQGLLEALATMRLHQLGAGLFASAFWIALPVVAMLMFANLALGIVSRVAPQMNIYAIGFPVTLAVGLVGVAATLPMLEQPYAMLMTQVLDLFGRR